MKKAVTLFLVCGVIGLVVYTSAFATGGSPLVMGKWDDSEGQFYKYHVTNMTTVPSHLVVGVYDKDGALCGCGHKMMPANGTATFCVTCHTDGTPPAGVVASESELYPWLVYDFYGCQYSEGAVKIVCVQSLTPNYGTVKNNTQVTITVGSAQCSGYQTLNYWPIDGNALLSESQLSAITLANMAEIRKVVTECGKFFYDHL